MKPSSPSQSSQRPTQPGVRQSLLLLQLLAEQAEGRSFSELVRLAGLPAATISRLLGVLQEEGWVEHAVDGHYLIGQAGHAFARAIGGPKSKAERIRSAVVSLAHKTGHSAAFTEWAGRDFTLP